MWATYEGKQQAAEEEKPNEEKDPPREGVVVVIVLVAASTTCSEPRCVRLALWQGCVQSGVPCRTFGEFCSRCRGGRCEGELSGCKGSPHTLNFLNAYVRLPLAVVVGLARDLDVVRGAVLVSTLRCGVPSTVAVTLTLCLDVVTPAVRSRCALRGSAVPLARPVAVAHRLSVVRLAQRGWDARLRDVPFAVGCTVAHRLHREGAVRLLNTLRCRCVPLAVRVVGAKNLCAVSTWRLVNALVRIPQTVRSHVAHDLCKWGALVNALCARLVPLAVQRPVACLLCRVSRARGLVNTHRLGGVPLAVCVRVASCLRFEPCTRALVPALALVGVPHAVQRAVADWLCTLCRALVNTTCAVGIPLAACRVASGPRSESDAGQLVGTHCLRRIPLATGRAGAWHLHERRAWGVLNARLLCSVPLADLGGVAGQLCSVGRALVHTHGVGGIPLAVGGVAGGLCDVRRTRINTLV